ncbi:molybdopterin-dependent oxidoreductase [Rubrobacter marinus]|uniref:Molybdopterin-dependent oxidoreductase n=1 Tax=Rubrobacter marinus TaxID=2653852 RepID=A0A6G8PVY9_9ACTN|nr:molybdopterin-dependent oxidoreductase [Rubrobacter marinus]QIN78381.1 molybdopterin-dependent oxidoreductase [Rubrobacter marinus]
MAGGAGMALALGLAELVHGVYALVPSVPVAISQRIIELTPGALATAGIGALGKAAAPVLIAVVVVSALLSGAGLAALARRSRLAALAGVAVLAAAALFAAFMEPFIAPVATVLTVLGSLGAGTLVSGLLLRSSGVPGGEGAGPEDASEEASAERREPEPFSGRYREAHSERGVAVNRRGFLALAGGAAAVGAAAAGTGRFLTGEEDAEVTGARPLESTQRGGPGQAVPQVRTSVPPPPPEASIEVPGMPPLITPAEDFYVIDTALSSPRINRERWTLNVRGAVENPVEFSYNDLMSLPVIEAYITLACVSNEVGGGLVSNAKWTGVPLSEVLREAGVAPDRLNRANEQLVGRSVDGWTNGFRTRTAFEREEALVAFAMNDDELPLKHGYPVRLVVPGLYGYVSATKWLTEIELTDRGYDAYWIQRGWSKQGPVKTQSRIDTVEPGATVQAGRVPIGGVAWAPTRGIERVEVSTDGGETWNDARLAAQLDVDAWRQYVYEWEAEPGEYVLKVRATDGEGETQTAEEAAPIPSGATGYHTIEATVV